jgi:peptidyl-prolyl cis-trans isomerase B (cyclophilin B)
MKKSLLFVTLVWALVSPAAAQVDPTEEVAIISTSKGEMTVAFWPDVAPATVANFKKLAKAHLYDGTCFHRVVQGFMIQGGDPNTKDAGHPELYGLGGPGYNIKAEFNDRSHVRGVISMARSASPDSAGSQFFICLDDAPFLNGKYTAFGKLIKGDNILGEIGSVPVMMNESGAEKSAPIERVEVYSIKIVKAGEAGK